MLRPGDWFLLGADLVKAKRRLDAAYNDAAGVTIQFNKNVLRVLNRDLRASFDEDAVRSRRRVRSASASWSTSACGRASPTR